MSNTKVLCVQNILRVQHLLYIALVAVVNISLIYAVYKNPTGVVAILLVSMVYFRDSVYVTIRVIDKVRRIVCKLWKNDEVENNSSQGILNSNNENQKLMINKGAERLSDDNNNTSNSMNQTMHHNVLCVLPTYKEEMEDVARTLDSLMTQKEYEMMNKRIIMVCDGFSYYTEMFSSMVLTEVIQYQTFRGKSITFNVFRAIYKSKDIVVIVKSENAGKKDSLILINKIFLHDDLKDLRKSILSIFNLAQFDYFFHTDADTVIRNDTLQCAIRIFTANPSVSAVAGLALVSEDFHFWSLYQGFEYYYEQIMCRLTESSWKKPFILPGCITMVKLSHESVVKASLKFQELPTSSNMFQINDRLQGTDRRYTNCFLLQNPTPNLLTSDQLHCFTKPPNSLKHFLSQRNRWLSNAISGYLFLLIGDHTPFYIRLLALFELVHVHTSVARMFSCCVLLVCLFQVNHLVLVSICCCLGFSVLFTIAHGCVLRSYVWFLLAGCCVSMLAGPLMNMCVFVSCILNFTNVSWGVSHGQKQKNM